MTKARTLADNFAADINGITAGTGISGGGTSGTVTVTNSMATVIDAKGDLVGGTGADTFARLAVGANGTVLTADSVETTGLKWVAPASGALTLVSRQSFSNVADTDTSFDGVFTSTYKSYQIVIETLYAATTADDLLFQWRYAGPTTQAANNFSNCITTNAATSTVTNSGVNGGSANKLTVRIGGSADSGGGIIFATGVSGVSTTPVISGMYYECTNAESANFSGMTVTARIYTGFLLKSSSSNITGTVAVYGLA
jgi:hypothetical protein